MTPLAPADFDRARAGRVGLALQAGGAKSEKGQAVASQSQSSAWLQTCTMKLPRQPWALPPPLLLLMMMMMMMVLGPRPAAGMSHPALCPPLWSGFCFWHLHSGTASVHLAFSGYWWRGILGIQA